MVLIVGAGLDGLAAALALNNLAKIRVQIADSKSFESLINEEKRNAVMLSPNGLRALSYFVGHDVVEKVINSGSKIKASVMLPFVDSKLSIRECVKEGKCMVFPLDDPTNSGYPQVLIELNVLNSILRNLLPQDIFITRTNIIGYEYCSEEESNDILPVARHENSMIDSNPLIVGADGSASTCRALLRNNANLILDDEESLLVADIKYNGRINVKSIVDESLGDEFEPEHSYTLVLPEAGLICSAGPAGGKKTYWSVSIMGTAFESNKGFRDFLSRVHDQLNLHVAKERLLLKLSCSVPTYCSFFIDLVRNTNPNAIWIDRSREVKPIGPFISKDRKVALVGSAAHTFVDSYGQAVNLALEDAATLASLIRDEDSMQLALEKYSTARVERCEEMHRRGVDRTSKAMAGSKVNDIRCWIYDWKL